MRIQPTNFILSSDYQAVDRPDSGRTARLNSILTRAFAVKSVENVILLFEPSLLDPRKIKILPLLFP